MKKLTIAEKEYKRIKKIGKGLFSWAYELDNGQVLILLKTHEQKATDCGKEALVDWVEPGNHIPEIEHIGEIFYCGFWCEAYIMPLYKKLHKNDPAYQDYRVIRGIIDFDYLSNYRSLNRKGEQTWHTDHIMRVAKAIKENLPKIGHAFEEIINAIANYDISLFNLDCDKTDNFAVGGSGELILLDVFCYRPALRDWWE